MTRGEISIDYIECVGERRGREAEMLEVTDKAKEKIVEFLEERGINDPLRVYLAFG